MTKSKVEIYIDMDNFLIPLRKQGNGGDNEAVVAEKLGQLFEIAQRWGKDVEAFAYANFRIQPFWVEKLLEAKGVCMIHTPSLNGTGKNADDVTMAVNITQLPWLKPYVRTILVVSGDGHFAPVVAAFHRNGNGRKALVVSTGEVNAVLKEAADEFLQLLDETDQSQKIEINLVGYIQKLQEERPYLTLNFLAREAAKHLPIKSDEAWQGLKQLLQKGVLEQYKCQKGEKQIDAIRLREEKEALQAA